MLLVLWKNALVIKVPRNPDMHICMYEGLFKGPYTVDFNKERSWGK